MEYTGLKGLVFDNETKEIAGYKQVKEENEKDKTLVIDATAFALQSVAGEEKKMEDESEKSRPANYSGQRNRKQRNYYANGQGSPGAREG